jgi:hypothetical protein
MKVDTVEDIFGGIIIACKQSRKIIAFISVVNPGITLETGCTDESLSPPDPFFDYNRDELTVCKNHRNEVSVDFKKNSGPNSINYSYSLGTRKISKICIHLSFTIFIQSKKVAEEVKI